MMRGDVLYAGDLRACGAEIPDSIPDCAWVPAHSVRMVPVVEQSGFRFRFEFADPFQWVRIDGVVNLKGGENDKG